MRLLRLVENESLKIIRRRRFTIIVAILCAILGVVAYSQYRQFQRRAGKEWRVVIQQRIVQYQNMLRRDQIAASWARSLRAEVGRLQYHLDRDIDPERPTAPFFARMFANAAGILLLPLLVAVLGSDLVSAEHSEGTDKLLLTRPVKRWKILLSKMLALFAFTTITLFVGGILAYVISSIVLDPRGWDAPMYTGFRVGDRGNLNFDDIRQVPLWQDALIAYGLEWFAMLVVASLALMLSVIFRSNAAAMGTMLASLIGGTILTRLSPDWTAGKYFFVSALPLAEYYTGQPPPYDGMPLSFCIALLAVWGAGALGVAFALFTRRDVFG